MPKSKPTIELIPAEPLRLYSTTEAAEFAKQWMDILCTNKQGVNTKAYLWHIFSSGRYLSVSGEEAISRYRQHSAPEYVVFSNDHTLAALTDRLPETCNLTDYYVSPLNLAWTMAFTHEDGWLGPYFAVHPNYEALNKKNLDHIRNNERKRQEIENARSKGWM